MEGQILGSMLSVVFTFLMVALAIMVIMSIKIYITEKRELKQTIQQERAKADKDEWNKMFKMLERQ